MLPVTPLPSCMLFTFRCWQPAQEEEEEEGEEGKKKVCLLLSLPDRDEKLTTAGARNILARPHGPSGAAKN